MAKNTAQLAKELMKLLSENQKPIAARSGPNGYTITLGSVIIPIELSSTRDRRRRDL